MQPEARCGWKQKKPARSISHISEYLSAHPEEQMTLDQAAKQAGMSKSNFCRVFKEENGCTFTEYRNSLRIARSMDYLCRTDMTMIDIAMETGFADPSYFDRIFKKHMGMTPTQYKESRQCIGWNRNA